MPRGKKDSAKQTIALLWRVEGGKMATAIMAQSAIVDVGKRSGKGRREIVEQSIAKRRPI